MRNRIQRIWETEDPRQKVLESLLLDFSTRGLLQRDSLDYWRIGNDFQIESVKRLLYYYPEVATPLIAQRLEGLRVSGDYFEDCVFNGVRTDDFIDAVAWTEHEAIRTELLRIAADVTHESIIGALQRAKVEIAED